MLAKEMHISFALGLQKLGALSRRKFYPQEIDNFLNQAQENFIKSAIKETPDGDYFHRAQVDVDKIKTLLVHDKLINANQETTVKQGLKKASIPLPPDYAYLISDSIGQICLSDATSTNDFDYLVVLPIIQSVGSTPFYAITKLQYVVSAVATTLVDLVVDTQQGLPAALYAGYPSKPDWIFVKQLLWEVFQEKSRSGAIPVDFELYWERYNGMYRPGNFILRVATTGYTGRTIIDATTSDYAAVSPVASYVQYTGTAVYYSSRQTKVDFIDNVLTAPFYKPLKTSPVSLIVDSKLIVYTPTSYIVSKIALTYIRKASRIDVGLQRNCELPEEFHQYIVDKAIEYAAGKLEQVPLTQLQEKINQETK